jgi:hypothetical protein
MANKKVLNKELSAKAKSIKGEVRSGVALAAMNARSSVQPNKKKQMKSSTRREKHKTRYV